MRLILIPDKFKGSLTGEELSQAIGEGVRMACPAAEIAIFPASDGGDGFLEVVRSVRDVEIRQAMVGDPLGREVRAPFLLDRGRGEAFVEMATASGMVLLEEAERNPLRTHTRGTGQLIRNALASGARKVYVGLGGSATNDGGCGLASAFGYRFLDGNGKPLVPNGGNLSGIARIIPPEDQFFREVEIIAVNDVSNPLWGEQGAARVYGRQKGASDPEILLLDAGLRHLDQVVSRDLGVDAAHMAGAGAAGGAAYGLHCFLNARMISGTEYVLGISGVEEYLSKHAVDFIITGEGRIDEQTLHGKLISGVLKMAERHGVPVLVVCGACDIPAEALRGVGITEVIEVSDPARPLAYNMAHAARLTREAVNSYFQKTRGA